MPMLDHTRTKLPTRPQLPATQGPNPSGRLGISLIQLLRHSTQIQTRTLHTPTHSRHRRINSRRQQHIRRHKQRRTQHPKRITRQRPPRSIHRHTHTISHPQRITTTQTQHLSINTNTPPRTHNNQLPNNQKNKQKERQSLTNTPTTTTPSSPPRPARNIPPRRLPHRPRRHHPRRPPTTRPPTIRLPTAGTPAISLSAIGPTGRPGTPIPAHPNTSDGPLIILQHLPTQGRIHTHRLINHQPHLLTRPPTRISHRHHHRIRQTPQRQTLTGRQERDPQQPARHINLHTHLTTPRTTLNPDTLSPIPHPHSRPRITPRPLHIRTNPRQTLLKRSLTPTHTNDHNDPITHTPPKPHVTPTTTHPPEPPTNTPPSGSALCPNHERLGGAPAFACRRAAPAGSSAGRPPASPCAPTWPRGALKMGIWQRQREGADLKGPDPATRGRGAAVPGHPSAGRPCSDCDAVASVGTRGRLPFGFALAEALILAVQGGTDPWAAITSTTTAPGRASTTPVFATAQ